jgi:beta-lactamase class A
MQVAVRGGCRMKPRGRLAAAAVAALLASELAPFLARPGRAANMAAVSSGICRSSSHSALAASLARDIQAARRSRVSTAAVRVDDPGRRLGCWLHGARHFDSASVVKVTILAALLRKALDQHRHLTDVEAAQASAMMTYSDNDAASALWTQLGHTYIRHFLDLAGMTQTALGPAGSWGLTQITAEDEMLLLRLLLAPNPVLDTSARGYTLHLMAHVIPAQRWGVPAGAPTNLTVHLKNGWLPLHARGWRVHSIGCFTGHGGGYSIVVLTQNNPTMAYGIRTIEAIARAVERDLNPAATSVIPLSQAAAR